MTIECRRRGVWALYLARLGVRAVAVLHLPVSWAVSAIQWALSVARIEYRVRMPNGASTDWTTKHLSEWVDVSAVTGP